MNQYERQLRHRDVSRHPDDRQRNDQHYSAVHNLTKRFDFLLDLKKRVQIPSEIRQSLYPEDEGLFILTKGIWNCIFAFPKSAWERRKNRLSELGLTSVELYQRKQVLNSMSFTCPMDKQFRIKIPDSLLEFANLEHEVAIVGVEDRVEFWNKRDCDTYYRKLLEDVSWDDVRDDLLLD